MLGISPIHLLLKLLLGVEHTAKSEGAWEHPLLQQDRQGSDASVGGSEEKGYGLVALFVQGPERGAGQADADGSDGVETIEDHNLDLGGELQEGEFATS